MAQIGGVYTPPEKRKQGFSTRLMKQMIKDSRNIHNIKTLILFTPKDNIPARKLYENLGFKRIGDFGLILWNQEIKEEPYIIDEKNFNHKSTF